MNAAKFRRKATALAQSPVASIIRIFGPWAQLPEDFGSPERKRLFSPL